MLLYFNFQDILALYLACLGHDVGHPGITNAFLVNTGAAIAMTYNDKSPLENMHACLFFEMLSNSTLNFLTAMTKKDFGTFRSKVVETILATDNAVHFDLVDRFSARVSQMEEFPFQVDTKQDREKQLETKEDRRMLLRIITHMSDLGHTCRPWHIHKHLVVALEEEFFIQGDKERELGMPIMPMMDRAKDSLAATQTFFLDKLVYPLLSPVTQLLSDEVGDLFKHHLDTNKVLWEALVEKYGKKNSAELVALDNAMD